MGKSIPAIVETIRGARSKLSLDFDLNLFILTKVLPEGFTFPLNFGSIPCTKADDGDPLDIVLFMSDSVPAGTIVEARPIGVLEAEQTEDGKTERNDRLFGVACESTEHRKLVSVNGIEKRKREEYEQFFRAYNEECGKKFRPLGWYGPKRAWKLVDRARSRYRPPKGRTALPARMTSYLRAMRED